jgi:hypothetical protein
LSLLGRLNTISPAPHDFDLGVVIAADRFLGSLKLTMDPAAISASSNDMEARGYRCGGVETEWWTVV